MVEEVEMVEVPLLTTEDTLKEALPALYEVADELGLELVIENGKVTIYAANEAVLVLEFGVPGSSTLDDEFLGLF